MQFYLMMNFLYFFHNLAINMVKYGYVNKYIYRYVNGGIYLKKPFIILMIISVLALFLGGFEYVKTIYHKPSKELWVGYNKSNENRNVIEFKNIKVARQSIVDKLEKILLYSKKTQKVDLSNYDVQVTFKNPNDKVNSYSTLILFTNEGAVIKMNGFSVYRRINKADARFIKELINYKEN